MTTPLSAEWWKAIRDCAEAGCYVGDGDAEQHVNMLIGEVDRLYTENEFLQALADYQTNRAGENYQRAIRAEQRVEVLDCIAHEACMLLKALEPVHGLVALRIADVANLLHRLEEVDDAAAE